MTYDQEAFIARKEGQENIGNTFETEVRDIKPGVVAVIKQIFDEDSPDTSHMGRLSADRQNWSIDRREGVLIGDYVETEYRRARAEENLDEQEQSMIAHAKADGWLEEYADFSYEIDEDTDEAVLFVDGLKTVAIDLRNGNNVDRWTRYFTNSNYDDETSAELRAKYLTEDYERYERLACGYWSFINISVEVYVMGILLSEDSMGGIESDRKEYIKETIAEMLQVALHGLSNSRDNKVVELRRRVEALESVEL